MSLDVLNRFLSDERKLSEYLDGPGSDTRMRQPKRRYRKRRKGDPVAPPRHVGHRYTAAQAYAAGFRYATIGPKGNIIAVHRKEVEGHRYVREGLRNPQCAVKPLEGICSTSSV